MTPGTYILNITTVALVGGICCDLAKEGFSKAIIRFLYGLMLTLTLLYPVSDFRLKDLLIVTESIKQEGVYASREGEEMANQAVSAIINEKIEEYILKKASDYSAKLDVEVILENNIPAIVILDGDISPYAKRQLEAILEKELGITKENQQWI